MGGRTASPPVNAPLWWLVGLTALGAGLGWLFLFSASYPLSAALTGNAFTIAFKQLLFLAGGSVVFGVAALCPFAWVRRGAIFAHLLVIGLLALTLQRGVAAGGAARWLAIGAWQVQPSEFAKVTLVALLAATMARCWAAPRWRERLVWGVGGVVAWWLTVALVAAQPHLSGALILVAAGAFTLLFARLPLWAWVATLVALGGLGYTTRHAFLHPYQVRRLQAAPHPFGDNERRLHYQSRQAQLGLGAGGLFGRGLFQSRQKYLFLPSAHNDFVFAVIGEEWGFAASVGVLAFFTGLAYWALRVAAGTTDPFVSGLAGGLGFTVWLQAMLHIAVNAGLLPPTGIPLPFVSAGGSALWSALLAMGLLVNAARQLPRPASGRGARDALGDGGWGHRGAHLPRHRPRHRRQEAGA